MTEMLTAEYLREILHYDPETGVFVWRRRPRNHKRVGEEAGWVCNKKKRGAEKDLLYRRIGFNRREYEAHRLAFLYMTGEWPDGDVDHIDGDSLNNRWCNLRCATRSANMANRGRNANNTTGFKGVSIHQGKYHSRIQVHGKGIRLGGFDTAAEAHAAYIAAAKKYFGEFARGE